MNTAQYSIKLKEKKLKVTPQRIAVLEAIHKFKNHPTAENIIECVRKNHPNISTGTVYKVIDTLISCGLIRRVTTERDIMRYDANLESHHHLYCSDSDRIEDYIDKNLDKLLINYFDKKKIHNFKIEDLQLHIIGRFINHKK